MQDRRVNYVLDITAGAGDWDEHPEILARFKKAKTSACPQAEESGSTGKGPDGVTGTWCKVDGINYIVEVVGMDNAGNSVNVTEAQDRTLDDQAAGARLRR